MRRGIQMVAGGLWNITFFTIYSTAHKMVNYFFVKKVNFGILLYRQSFSRQQNQSETRTE
jgi:hypothetical protein